MPKQTDPEFLSKEEYGDATDLTTRIRIQARYRKNPKNWFAWLFERFRLPKNSRILELGCGPGHLWGENLFHMPPTWQVHLSDLSTGMLQDARDRLPPGSDRFTFSVLDAQAIPFPAEAFEAVIASGLLDHVPDRVRSLDEIQRVLKPGGFFFTTTGSQGHLREIETLVQPFIPEADYGGDPERFGLENGAKYLAPWFGEIQLERYPDELVFKQARPILAYVRSEAQVKEKLKGEKLAAFCQFVENELAARGEIRVTSKKGLFTAMKAKPTP
ncbi:MAG TPA: class I SAM-dependent methyltransferase [Anaerolineales bacterium]